MAPSSKLVKTYNGQKIVLYLGYLNPLKNIDQLILAVKQIDDPSIRLLIVGSGPAETSLREIAQGDRRIKFLGYLDGQNKTDILQISNVVVLPTLADCWGLVVNEALYYGKPVITTSLAGASELLRLKGSVGRVIAPNNIDILSRAIKQTLDQDYRSHIQSADYLRLKHMISDPILGAKPILRAITKAEVRS